MGSHGAASAVAIPTASEQAAVPLWRRDDAPIRIGISSCLLGRPVRWDGGHKRDAFLVDQLGPFVEWVPVCPELEIGMGVPREVIHLARRGDAVRLVAERSGSDYTRSDRRELAESVEDYGRGLVPLIVPITLVRHHVRRLDVAYLAGQVYLEPHPKELMLRNRV